MTSFYFDPLYPCELVVVEKASPFKFLVGQLIKPARSPDEVQSPNRTTFVTWLAQTRLPGSTVPFYTLPTKQVSETFGFTPFGTPARW